MQVKLVTTKIIDNQSSIVLCFVIKETKQCIKFFSGIEND